MSVPSNISRNLEFTYYLKFLAFKHNRHRIIILNYVKLQPEEDEDSGSEYTVQEEDDDEFEGLLIKTLSVMHMEQRVSFVQVCLSCSPVLPVSATVIYSHT